MITHHYKETNLGFEFEDASVERLFSHRGYAAIRIRSRSTGEYVDVQLSPKGRNIYIHRGNLKNTVRELERLR